MKKKKLSKTEQDVKDLAAAKLKENKECFKIPFVEIIGYKKSGFNFREPTKFRIELKDVTIRDIEITLQNLQMVI